MCVNKVEIANENTVYKTSKLYRIRNALETHIYKKFNNKCTKSNDVLRKVKSACEIFVQKSIETYWVTPTN